MAHSCLSRSPSRLRTSSTSLISKGGGVGHACKVHELRGHDLFFVLAPAAFDRANGHHLHLRPHSSRLSAPCSRRCSSPGAPRLSPGGKRTAAAPARSALLASAAQPLASADALSMHAPPLPTSS